LSFPGQSLAYTESTRNFAHRFAIFPANFSRLNFDSGAKIREDIIKYDYPGKVEERKKDGADMYQRERRKGGRRETEGDRVGKKRRMVGSG